ncbi:hypothetical protein [Vibrio cholerae]|uniref:hypothetical protein n=1 Tax=Vibrio cholerae TaxID=666 RepID=UPI001C90CF63|nr:hypothetical protein [Vibrio cholerae]MBY3691508.1 hypothetical protein [Vibrio cholerae]
MSESFKNQNTLKMLGFTYQVLLAIEKCLDAKSNETIYIECLGDISDGSYSLESKHHFNNGNVTDNSYDFWNTFKNLVTEDTSTFDKLILHTTEIIPNKGIFLDWEKSSSLDKYKKLKAHTPSSSVKTHYDAVFKADKKDVLKVLDRLVLLGGQPKIDELYERILGNNTFTLVEESQRLDILKWLHGHVEHKAIENKNKWHIDINSFKVELRDYATKFVTDEVIFPYISENNIKNSDRCKYHFLTELSDIGVKEISRHEAFLSYLRMLDSKFELLKRRPMLMKESIEKYRGSVKNRVSNLKSSNGRHLTIQDFESDNTRKAALNTYYDFINSECIQLLHVKGTEPYFMYGKAHALVEERIFTWNYKKSDLE